MKITFDSMEVLTKREALDVLESLLAMNGIGITKINRKFFKAVPATNMNVHVPIWLDGPASSLKPSQLAGDSISLPVDFLSDREELALIEGLDEPMERLKLRDQGSNMILDMLQLITGRHIFAAPEPACSENYF